MSLTDNETRAAQILLFTRIVSGVKTNIITPIMLSGGSTTPAALEAVFTDAVQASTDLDAAKLAYQKKLVAQRAAFATAHTTAEALKSYAYGVYGKDNPILGEFGFPVAKPAVKSAQVKADAVEKSAATRLARHTMGSKQKADIHGTVTVGPTVTGAAAGTPPATGGTPGTGK